MAALPTPGGDVGVWGGELNTFLSVAMNSDGTLKNAYYGSAILNVKDYGAKGDGTTDDTTAFRNAVAAVPANGAVIVVPPGQYKIVGSGGVGFDISGVRVHFLGAGPRSVNEGLLSGSVIFTPTASLTLVKHVNASIFQNGPVFENITFGENVGSGVTLVQLNNVNTHLFRNCSFIGNTGNSSTVGLSLDGSSDISYGLVDFCYFRNCQTGFKQASPNVSITRVNNSYFVSGAGGSAMSNYKLIDATGSGVAVTNCKFEGNDNTGAIAISVNGLGCRVFGNSFEGCPIGVDGVAQASQKYMGLIVANNDFTGDAGTETAVRLGANFIGSQVIGNSAIFLSKWVDDADPVGNQTLVTHRPDFSSDDQYMSLGGVALMAGGANPPTSAPPNGSTYFGANGLWFRTGGAWTKVTVP